MSVNGRQQPSWMVLLILVGVWCFVHSSLAISLPAQVQHHFDLPALASVNVISNKRDSRTVLDFLDAYLPISHLICVELPEQEESDKFTVEGALFRCIDDPSAEGCFFWLSNDYRGSDDVERGTILVKSMKFLSDGHVIFCLSTYDSFQHIKEREVLDGLKKHLGSPLGYIGNQVSLPVSTYGEFLHQMEEHGKEGHHWSRKVGIFDGEEMTVVEWLKLLKDRKGISLSRSRMKFNKTGLALFDDEDEDEDFLPWKTMIEANRPEHYFCHIIDSNQDAGR